MTRKYKLALCQMTSSFEKEESLQFASEFVTESAKGGASVVSLPEMWNCPYNNKYFAKYAEPAWGRSFRLMSDLAKDNKIILIGGSIPELEGDNLYNTSFVFGPDGRLIGRHRKIHLFDVDVQGGVVFHESDTLSAGDSITVVETEFGKIGVAICYDVRFPAMFNKMADDGAHLIVLPASFSLTTGAVHWDILMKSRAIEDQVYFAACSPARDPDSEFKAYGHSCIVNPWGEFCAIAATEKTIVYGEIDLDYMDRVRQEIPIRRQKREDVY